MILGGWCKWQMMGVYVGEWNCGKGEGWCVGWSMRKNSWMRVYGIWQCGTRGVGRCGRETDKVQPCETVNIGLRPKTTTTAKQTTTSNTNMTGANDQCSCIYHTPPRNTRSVKTRARDDTLWKTTQTLFSWKRIFHSFFQGTSAHYRWLPNIHFKFSILQSVVRKYLLSSIL